MNHRLHVTRIADKLDAIANWQNEQGCAPTKTGLLLNEAAVYLRTLHNGMCRHGFVGCQHGDTCMFAENHQGQDERDERNHLE